MDKRFVLLLAAILGTLTACAPASQSEHPAALSPAEAIATGISVPTSDRHASPTPQPYPSATASSMLQQADQGAAFRITASGQIAPGVDVVAEYKGWNPIAISQLIQCNASMHDLLISLVVHEEGMPDESLIEQESLFYIFELLPGQAIRVAMHEDEELLYRFAYTNKNGIYEAYLVKYDKASGSFTITETDANNVKSTCDDTYINYEPFFPADFKARVMRGDFDAYIPKGFCITAGSLGDIDDDGIEDALLMLSTAGKRVDAYGGVMPMFILLGRGDGEYILAGTNPSALFAPYRSDSHPIAGKGYIDIQNNYVDGAASHHKVVSRFFYDEERHDWFLKEFSYRQLNYDDPSKDEPEFVRALPHFSGISIFDYTGSEAEQIPADFSSFDCAAEFYPSGNTSEFSPHYTIGVNANEATGYYEGYVYKHYDSFSAIGFIGTLRGEYNEDKPLNVVFNPETRSVAIQDDEWEWDEYIGHGEFFKK